MPGRIITASERIYQLWLHAANEEDEANYSGQLVAICISACNVAGIPAPSERREISGRTYWSGGARGLARWVRSWVDQELVRETPLKDGGRYIGRRCKNALIDDLRWHARRRRGAPTRIRKKPYDKEDAERMREGMCRVLAAVGLPGRLPIAGDQKLFELLMAAYPDKLSNVAIARELNLSEGAIRKRRKRII